MTVSADTSTPRVVLVTGALGSAADAASIGRALATGFARRGWDVALQRSHGAPRAAADALVAEVAALGRRAAVLDADLALEANAAALVAACGEALGRPACAVFVSASAGADDAHTVDGASLAAALARNVTAPLALARALADATPDAAREHEALRACATPRTGSGAVSPRTGAAVARADAGRVEPRDVGARAGARTEGAGRGARARPRAARGRHRGGRVLSRERARRHGRDADRRRRRAPSAAGRRPE
ncbi:putative oxidoreductase protein [Burkholderia cenocepacia]|nr:putative oxidoreductase protein [Burkholderia cenocepacia]